MKLIEVLGEAAAMVVRGMTGKASHEQNFKKSSCRDPVGALYTAPRKQESLGELLLGFFELWGKED